MSENEKEADLFPKEVMGAIDVRGVSIFKSDSPCIGMCSTSYGDLICLGCGRTSAEIVEWIDYDEERKGEIWSRVEAEGTAVRFRRHPKPSE